MTRCKKINKIKLFLVEDSESDINLIKECLQEENDVVFELNVTSTLEDAKQWLYDNVNSCPDVILLDLNLPDSEHLDTFYVIKDTLEYNIPIIIFTTITERTMGLEAIKNGASDYLFKFGMDSQTLIHSILKTVVRSKLFNELDIIYDKHSHIS